MIEINLFFVSMFVGAFILSLIAFIFSLILENLKKKDKEKLKRCPECDDVIVP